MSTFRSTIKILITACLLISCGGTSVDAPDIADSLFPLESAPCQSVPADTTPATPIRLIPDNSPFVVVTDIDSTIRTDIRYASPNNFVGAPLDGYLQPVAILSRPAALALARVNTDLRQQGYALLIYDAYRPQRAVNHIMRWSHDGADTLMRQQYYPTLTKLQIRQQGFISKRSRHALGSTVDLTLIDLHTQQPVDMGSPFDLFAPISNYSHPHLTAQQMANRRLLRTAMGRQGFYPIEAEWWHFTLRHQPYTSAFDFPVHADSAYAVR